jgi:hypothetical protein
MSRGLAAVVCIVLAGCVVRARPVVVAAAHGPEPISPGRPAFHSGSPEAYWVWHDEGGWHLRTTTAGARHRFHGWVEPIGGRVEDFRPTRLEWGDRVRVAARGIEFDFETAGAEDGFDWRVSSGCSRFELFIDGAAHPGKIHLGGAASHPHHTPFERCR